MLRLSLHENSIYDDCFSNFMTARIIGIFIKRGIYAKYK